MLKNYEMTLIVDSQQQEEGVEKTVARYTDLIASQGGSVHKADTVGVRKLAYEIKRHQQASYTFVQFQTEPAMLTELERLCRLDEAVLRHMVVLLDELDPLPEEVEEVAASEAEDADAEEAEADKAEDEDSEADDSEADDSEEDESDDGEGGTS